MGRSLTNPWFSADNNEVSDQAWALQPSKFLEERARISAVSADTSSDGCEEIDSEAHATLLLVERAQRGDKEAFGLLYKEHHGSIYRFARTHLHGAAEDAVGETFLRAWKALPRYTYTGAPFVAWLYGIARHVVTDELRRRGRTETREELPEAGIEFDTDDRLVLASAIGKLPRDQRRIIEMKYLLGMKNPEVAKVLGKGVGAVNAAQWRALKKLREILEAES